MEVEVRNNARAAQGILTAKGRVWIAPGQTRLVEVDSLSRIQSLSFLEVVGEQAAAPIDLAKLSVSKLKAMAEDEGIDLGDAKTKADIITAIELAREAAGQK